MFIDVFTLFILVYFSKFYRSNLYNYDYTVDLLRTLFCFI